MKRCAVLFLAGLFIFLLSGCTASDLQEKGTAFAEAAFSGDYDAAQEQMTETMSANTTQESLDSMVTAVENQFGSFVEVASVTVANEADYPDHTISRVKVKLENSYVILELAYDQNQALDGLNLLATEEMEGMAAVTDNPSYTQSAGKFLENAFAGNVDEAVTYLAPETQGAEAADSLAAMVDEAVASYGEFQEVGAIETAGAENAVNVTVVFQSGSAIFQLTFNDQRKITDFSVYAQ